MQGRCHKAGFTLIEMMIAVAIIGVLASVALPQFAQYKHKTRYAEAYQVLGTLYKGQASFWALYVKGASSQEQGLATGRPTPRIICYAPMNDDQSNIRIPTPEPVIPELSETCMEMGFPAEAVYFSYAAGVADGTGPTEWRNLALEDFDGDGLLGVIVEYIDVNDENELRHAGRQAAQGVDASLIGQ